MTDNHEIATLLQKEHYGFDDLSAIMRILRSEGGCPWDREQDHHSIRSALIEETYEVVEAIDNEDPALLREELGDLLFQIFFHAQIETEENRFGVDEVVDDISKKMIHRHPHVFGEVEVENSSEVLKNWENIKTEEKQRNTLVDKLRAIPPMMPALMRASKVCKKAGRSQGMELTARLDVMEAQIKALKSALPSSESALHTAIGELLINVADLSGTLGVDAEHALSSATDRLIDQIAEKNS